MPSAARPAFPKPAFATPQEVGWLVTTAWNRGAVHARLGRAAEAERFQAWTLGALCHAEASMAAQHRVRGTSECLEQDGRERPRFAASGAAAQAMPQPCRASSRGCSAEGRGGHLGLAAATVCRKAPTGLPLARRPMFAGEDGGGAAKDPGHAGQRRSRRAREVTERGARKGGACDAIHGWNSYPFLFTRSYVACMHRQGSVHC